MEEGNRPLHKAEGPARTSSEPLPAAWVPAPPSPATWLAWWCPSRRTRSSSAGLTHTDPAPPPPSPWPALEGTGLPCPLLDTCQVPSKQGASTSERPACTPFPPRSSAPQTPLPEPHLPAWSPPLGSQASVPGFSEYASLHTPPTQAHSECQRQGPRSRHRGSKKSKRQAHTIGAVGEKNLLKASSPQTPLIPSGYHRCSVTAEICLPEAGTGEYFWSN